MYSSLGTSLAGIITESATLTAVAECFLQVRTFWHTNPLVMIIKALLWLLLTKVDQFKSLDKKAELVSFMKT